MEIAPRRRVRPHFADFLRCDWPLPAPDGVDANALEFQTRSLAGRRDRFTITAQGALLRQRVRPSPRASLRARGLAVLLAEPPEHSEPAIGPVAEFTGEIRFGAGLGRPMRNGLPRGWIEYEAIFRAGRLESVRLVRCKPPGSGVNPVARLGGYAPRRATEWR